MDPVRHGRCLSLLQRQYFPNSDAYSPKNGCPVFLQIRALARHGRKKAAAFQRQPQNFRNQPEVCLFLYDSLRFHCINNFLESCNVGSYHIVALEAVFLSSVCCIVADIYHDVFQFCVNFLKCPAQTLAVL